MAHAYSLKSSSQLGTCHPHLQLLFHRVLGRRDHTILCGRRTRNAQQLAYDTHHSKVQWPNSPHNCALPNGDDDTSGISMAVDLAPYPIDWGDTGTPEQNRKALARFYEFHGYVRREWELIREEIPAIDYDLTWGGDWDGDLDFSDQTFDDLVHWQLKREA